MVGMAALRGHVRVMESLRSRGAAHGDERRWRIALG